MAGEVNTRLYPLSPMQQGMLFHALSHTGSGVDIEQIVVRVHEPLDRARFTAAWSAVMTRHAILRTRFVWDRGGEPQQEVVEAAELTPVYEDWRDLGSRGQEERLEAFLARDRATDFDMSAAPLLRIAAFETKDDERDEHVFVWTFHHALLDGRSFPLVLGEVFAHYEGHEGEACEPRPYQDFIEWFHSDARPDSEAFWRRELKSYRAPAPLSFMEPAAPHAEFIGAVIEARVPAAITRGLRDLAFREQVTLHTVVQAGFALLLSRYSREAQVVFGSTRACRHSALEGAESMVGLFINTVPFRVDASPEQKLGPWLREVRAHHVALREHEHSSLLDVHEWSPIPRSSPLFESLLVFEHEQLNTTLQRRGGRWSNREFRYLGQTNFPLALLVYGEDEMLLRFEYDASRCDHHAVTRLAGHLSTLFQGFVELPDGDLGSFPLLTSDERAQTLGSWNDTACDYDPRGAVHLRVDAVAARSPDRVAARFGNQVLDYAALTTRANQLAHHLRSLGVSRDALVGICLDRGLDMLVAALAVMKAGGAYVPLDPHHPRERLALIAEDAGLSILLTESSVRDRIPTCNAEVLLLDELRAELARQPTAPPAVPIDGEQLAYAIFTSGSTGRPKGVEVPHRALSNFLSSMAREPGLTEGDHLLAVTTFSFDIAALELFLPLTVGASVEIADYETAMDAYALRERLEVGDVTVMQATPTTWHMLVEAGWKGTPGLRALCGGEALTLTLAEALLSRCASLWNMYGPTETTIWSSLRRITAGDEVIRIGRPIDNTTMFVLTPELAMQPAGAIGELFIGGDGLARGYRGQAELTEERFITNTPEGLPERLYRTGDLARFSPDGELECLGRMDFQVKVRGFRIELGDIEAALRTHPGVADAVAVVRGDEGDRRIFAYVVSVAGAAPSPEELRDHVAAKLPPYMVPVAFGTLDEFPLTPNNKVDRKALPDLEGGRPTLSRSFVAPTTETEQHLAALWAEVLKIDRVGVDDNFFDLGGNSISAVQVIGGVQSKLGKKLPAVRLFQYPTISGLAAFLDDGEGASRVRRLRGARRVIEEAPPSSDDAIAVVGVAVRLPGANDPEQLWENLAGGVESITRFPLGDLADSLDPAVVGDPAYVPARGVVRGLEDFDAGYFGMNPREAQLTDPQHRLFLEVAVEALERAGHDPDRFDGHIGVFGGMGNNSYLRQNLAHYPLLVQAFGEFQTMLANEKDYLATRVAYKLDLDGPAVSVQTACSTSLVAICQAFQSLRNGDCDLALAGGVSVFLPQRAGNLWQEGGIASRDGHCRPFDREASGTVFSSGAAMVVLRRLADAVADGDHVLAVMRGVGVNNDGAGKVSFMAPSVDGQAAAIAMAVATAGVEARTISYVEAHGTATPMGDPIEFEGLKRGHGEGAQTAGRCALGSIKSNIGHLDAAAGAAGFIKTTLMLSKRTLVPTLHYREPNPEIDFGESRYRVQTTCEPWPALEGEPRRAGVSSFGVGGTNAHVVLEEAPVSARTPTSPRASRSPQLLLLGARTRGALDAATDDLASHLHTSKVDLADAAFTLATGRRHMPERRFAVCEGRDDAVRVLEERDANRMGTRRTSARNPPVVFMFPGQGAQYVGMGEALYRSEPVVRDTLDDVSEILRQPLGFDLREVLFRGVDEAEDARNGARLAQTHITQPAIFALELALARLWISWGIRPALLVGHSSGEYVAACIAGVMRFEDAARLVAERGRIIGALPGGSMLSVRRRAEEVVGLLNEEVTIAAYNGPELCVLAGPDEAVAEMRERLAAEGFESRLLRTSHAFHSAMMNPALDEFTERLASVELRPPTMPWVSTVTGRLITPEEAQSPAYWARHIREPVRFEDAVRTVWEVPHRILLEVGPRRTLATLARQQVERVGKQLAISTLSSGEPKQELQDVLNALGQLWTAGVEPDWGAYYAAEQRRRVVLPTYPFERQRRWLDAPAFDAGAAKRRAATSPSGRATDAEGALGSSSSSASSTKPTSVVSQILASLETASGVDLKEVEDTLTFTEMGFDSLFLTQWARTLSRSFEVDVAFRDLLESLSSPSSLAAHLESIREPGQTAPEAQTEPRSEMPAPSPSADPGMGGRSPHGLPMTEAQREIWLASQLGAEASCAFNLCNRLTLTGELNHEALREALDGLLARHQALRSWFATSGTTFHVEPVAEIGLTTLDLRGLDPEDRERRLAELLEGEVHTPFDLERPPLMRAHLVRVSADVHEFVLTMHHVVADGWSLGVIFRDLEALYTQYAAGGPAPPAPNTLVEYTKRLAMAPEIALRESATAYWAEVHADGGPTLELPVDGERPPSKTHHGEREDLELDPELLPKLRRLGGRSQASLFTTLLASFEVLLARVSGQTDLVVGIPAAQQPVYELPHLVGGCVNTLPLRSSVKVDQPFAGYLRQLSTTVLDAFEHSQVTFSTLLPHIPVPRDPRRNLLVPVYFNLEEGMTFDFAGLTAVFEHQPRAFEMFELTFHVFIRGARFGVECTYNADLFDRETIQRRLAEYREVLESIARNPEAEVGALNLLPPTEATQLDRWNDTERAFPRDRGVHHLIGAQASENESAVAVVFRGQEWAYGKLDRQANRLAHILVERGVKRDSLVGVCVERSPEMLVSLLATLKAGGAYVPIDPTHPADRIALILEDARPRVLITRESVASALRVEGGCEVLLLDALDLETPTGIGPPDVDFDEEDLAYVIYTSGSTGKPKGVELPHRAVTNFLKSMSRGPGLGADDCLLAVTTMAFDIAVLELYLPLVVGARLEIADEDTCLDSGKLARLLDGGEFTVMQATPATWRMVVDAGFRGTARVKALCGGEALSAELRALLVSRCTEVWNMYGPTETTVWSTCGEMTPTGPVLIGRPIENTQIHVLDGRRGRVPIGVIGELCIGGAGLARGYRNLRELTGDRFIETASLGRLYRTGDLGRWLPDGRLECLGRLDFQVKVRGFRIELGEVESVLSRVPGVGQAVVHTVGEGEDKRLAAYLRRTPDTILDLSAARDVARQNLPGYMVPAYFTEVSEFPLTPNGKVDRKNLPAPNTQSARVSGTRDTRPRSPIEAVLMEVWAEILGVSEVGRGESFFELGGHSMQAIRMIQHVHARGLEVAPTDLFQRPTIAALANAIGTRTATDDDGDDGCLIALREAHGRPAIFLLHSLPGDLLQYGPLVDALGTEVACYGLQALGLRHPERAHRSIDQMADHYVDIVTRFQPEGPYHFAGWCFGGNVALAMAQALRARGIEVGSVTLLESWPRRSPFEQKLYRARMLIEMGIDMVPAIAHRARVMMETEATRDPGELFALDADLGPFRNRKQVYEADLEALLGHRTASYPGTVTLLQATDRPKHGLRENSYGWHAFAQEVEAHAIPGAHRDLMTRSHVARVADILRGGL